MYISNSNGSLYQRSGVLENKTPRVVNIFLVVNQGGARVNCIWQTRIHYIGSGSARHHVYKQNRGKRQFQLLSDPHVQFFYQPTRLDSILSLY